MYVYVARETYLFFCNYIYIHSFMFSLFYVFKELIYLTQWSLNPDFFNWQSKHFKTFFSVF